MGNIAIKSRAKINLSLDILGRRPDGYHEISTIMAEIPLFDEIRIKKTENGINLIAPPFLPDGRDNLAYRAAELFFETSGISGGVEINLDKRIPIGSGLGGGSSNAGSIIKALDAMFATGLDAQKKLEMAASLGADVPFFLTGGVALCEGIGERVSPITSFLKGLNVVLCKPEGGLSAGEVYLAYDRVGTSVRPDTGAMVDALERGDVAGIACNTVNALEDAAISILPEIGVIKAEMLSLGALNACMSGSGSAVFGVFLDRQTAAVCAESLAKKYRQVFLLEL